MDGPIRSLLALVQESGRIPDASGLPSLLASLAQDARERGLPAGFLDRSVAGALATADPRAALNRLARLLTGLTDPNFLSLLEDEDGLRSLLAILGYSGYLSSLIMRSPEDYIWLMRQAGLAQPRSADAMREDLSGRVGPDPREAKPSLRRFKYREMLRIGVRDLLGTATLEQTVREISSVAETAIDAAVGSAYAALKERHGVPLQPLTDGSRRPCKFSVLGMGKLGGGELNYSSDVDLFYLYSSHEGATTGRPSASGGYRDSVENHRFFVRLSETVTALLNDRTPDGIVFRVDLRLRPEGEQGEIAYSLPSLEVYYQSWGRTTDRLALLKGRPVGGDRRLGEEFLGLMEPFVYRRLVDYNALEEIGVLKEKIDRQAALKGGGARDVKLGRGGIREIEFLVQSLQLIHGGRNPGLRERNTLMAMERLMRNGFLAERDAGALAEAYRFLRDVEHKVQLVEERQTQSVPASAEDRGRLAWAMGFVRDGRPDAEGFLRRVDSVMDEVRARFERLVSVSRPSSAGQGDGSGLLREGLTAEAAVPELRAAGFTDPETAWRNLVLLRDGPPYSHFSDTCRHLLRQIAPRLLAESQAVPDPDAVLNNLVRFIGRVGARASYYSMLADNPEAIRLLAVLFGSSPFLSAFLVRQPDLLDVMVGGTDLGAARPAGEVAEEVRGALSTSPSFEDELAVLRRCRNAEVLRIGLGDLLGLKGLEVVQGELTALAEVLLKASLDLALRDSGAAGRPGALAIVAMGKMGGREMNYGSDLDLIFLYEGGEEDRTAFTKAAQRLITVLTSPTGEGVLYRVDMRLRPSGHAGPLVATLDSFLRYHREEAMLWERQAAVKARCVAGDPALRARVESAVDEVAYGRGLSAEDLAQIRRVRSRMEQEIGAEAGGGHYDIKAGRGGVVDIEFAVQALQLARGATTPAVRGQSTLAALDALSSCGLVGEKPYNTLRRAYLFYRGIENRSQIHSDRPDPRIPLQEERALPLARRLGYHVEGRGASDFLEEVRRTREEVRAACDGILDGLAKGLTGN